jgi:phosphoribosylformylglycinamidine synthase
MTIQSAITAYLPVFDGTNGDYDMTRAMHRAGAKVSMSVFCNLKGEDIFSSIAEMKKLIDQCQIFAISGGFSAADEPDGSGKYIANVLLYDEIAAAIDQLLRRGGLILGICNGFQALLRAGLLPHGRCHAPRAADPALLPNDINRHISCMTTTRVVCAKSPWLHGFSIGEQHTIPISHGEGKFTASNAMAEELFEHEQVAFEYVENPNGSMRSIEGITDPSGQILGKMGHSERYDPNIYKNIYGNKCQDIFANALRWFD